MCAAKTQTTAMPAVAALQAAGSAGLGPPGTAAAALIVCMCVHLLQTAADAALAARWAA